MNRPILKTISPQTAPITRGIDDFIFKITDQAKAIADPSKLDFLSKTVSTGMRDNGDKVFTLGGLGIGRLIDDKLISRTSATVISSPEELASKIGYDFHGGAGKGVNFSFEAAQARARSQGKEISSLLGSGNSSLKVGELKNFIAINASKINNGQVYSAPITAFHEFGHSASSMAGFNQLSNSMGSNLFSYLDEGSDAATHYINSMVTSALEESRAETYAYHKLFQSDEMLKIGKSESIFKNTGYFNGFGFGNKELPFNFMYGEHYMGQAKGMLKPGEIFDEMDTIIKGDIHANAALVSTIGFGGGNQSQLPFLQKHISNVRSNILEKHGEKYALEYDMALEKYGKFGRLGLSSDSKLVSEAAQRTAAYEARKTADAARMAKVSPVTFSMGDEPAKISAKIASKEIPKTIEEGVSVAVRHGGTRELLAAGSHAAQAVAHNDSAAMRLAGAAATILRKRF